VTTTAAGTWSSEKAWSDGGGGNSAYVSKPAWQVGVAMTGSNRGVPDISSDADPGSGVPVYDSTKYENYVGWNVFGGTSVSTPCLAGMTNLSGGAFTGTTAFLQVLYSKYATTPYPFRDITTGTASSKNASNPALVGWDYATGVGTPIATTSLSPVTISVPPSPVGLLSGTSAAFTATVSGAASAAVEWSASGGTITPGSPSSSASFSAAATGVYTLTATAAAYPSATATITVDVHQDDFLDPAVSGLDVLDLVGHFGASDPALALAGDQVVSLLDLDLMLQKLGW
jgi:kumamolisin